MRIGVVGMSYRSSELSLRESFINAMRHIQKEESEVVILTTCHRTEIYFTAKHLEQFCDEILLKMGLSQEAQTAIYRYFGERCFRHLASVVCGADSLIFGESEIQRQVKIAYLHASRPLNSALHYLFQKALKIGKQVRSTTAFPKSQTTIESTLFEVVQNLKSCSILFIGHSDINRKIAMFLKRQGMDHLVVATRHEGSLDPVYKKQLCFNQLSEWTKFDIVIAATQSNSYLIDLNDLNKIENRCRLIVDLSVPRSVDPSLKKAVPLLNIEDLNSLILAKKQGHNQDVSQIQRQIEALVKVHFLLGVDKEKKRETSLF